MKRRTLIGTAGMTGLLIVSGGWNPAQAIQKSRSFIVRREGSVIGQHRLDFVRTDTELRVKIDIDLDVRLIGLVPVYRYRHSNTERWVDGRLMSFASTTDDNGEVHEVTAQRVENGIEVVTDGDLEMVSSDASPTTYWHRSMLDARKFINTQSGEVIKADVIPDGTDTVVTESGDRIEAEHFAFNGDLDLELWYRDEDWVKLAFTGPDGSRIDYTLEGNYDRLALL